MTVIAQNWMKIMLLSLFIYILLLQHFEYSHPVLLYSANLSVVVCVSSFFLPAEKQDIMFSEERGNILKPPLVIMGLKMFGTLKFFFELLPLKIERFIRQTMMVHSIYLLEFRTSEKQNVAI